MMPPLRPFFVVLLLCAPNILAQSNPGLQEYERRQQDAALQRARQLKAAKEAVAKASQQQANHGVSPATSANRRKAAAAAPPQQIRLVTKHGTMNWTPGTPMPVAAQAPQPQKRGGLRQAASDAARPTERKAADAPEPRIRTFKLSLGRKPAESPVEEDGEDATVQNLGHDSGEPIAESSPADAPVAVAEPAEPAATVDEPFAEVETRDRGRKSWLARRIGSRKAADPGPEAEVDEAAEATDEILAVVEETPPDETGKPAKTRLLGVLLPRGRQNQPAELEVQPAGVELAGQPEEAAEITQVDAMVEAKVDGAPQLPSKRRPSWTLISFNRKTQPELVPLEEIEEAVEEEGEAPEEPAVDEAPAEIAEEAETEPDAATDADSEDDGKEAGLKNWHLLAHVRGMLRRNPDLDTLAEETTADDAVEGPEKPKKREKPTGPVDPNYFAVADSHVPFHVIDTGPEDTFVIELNAGTVGRTHGSGDNWTWLEMHDGLMGLMRKKHLRPAHQSEVMTYLAMESGASGPQSSPQPVQFVEIDLPELPSDSPEPEMALGEGLLPPIAEDPPAAMPEEPADEPVEKPGVETIEVPPAE